MPSVAASGEDPRQAVDTSSRGRAHPVEDLEQLTSRRWTEVARSLFGKLVGVGDLEDEGRSQTRDAFGSKGDVEPLARVLRSAARHLVESDVLEQRR